MSDQVQANVALCLTIVDAIIGEVRKMPWFDGVKIDRAGSHIEGNVNVSIVFPKNRWSGLENGYEFMIDTRCRGDAALIWVVTSDLSKVFGIIWAGQFERAAREAVAGGMS